MEKMNSIILLLFICLVSLGQGGQLVLSSQFFTNQFTDNDFGSWAITGSNIPSDHFFSQCGTQRIFGGYKKFRGDPLGPTKISRQYLGLIAHHAIRVQAKIYKIDSYSNENIFIMVDNVAQKIYNFQQTNSTQNICGDPYPVIDSINKNYNDSIVQVDFVMNHNSSVLDLSIETDLNSDKGWWGVRQIKVILMQCDKSCKSCTNATACTSCDSSIAGLTLIGAYCECTVLATIKQLITQCTAMPCLRCVTSCSPGYYYSAISTKCEPCNAACSTCSGPSNTVSPACSPCANGFFRNNPLTQPCYSCLGFCDTCSALSLNACTSCKQGYFLLGSQCLSSCPNGTYSEENTRQCFPCSGSCLTCDGSTGFHCTSCTGILYLSLATNQCLPSCNPPFFKYNNKCLQQCPLSTFQDYVLYTCTSCVSDCALCMNSVSCSKCNNGFFLSNGLCVASCPTTHYQSLSLGQCVICHTDCLQCFGSSSSSCKICSDANKILLNGSCYASCPNGTFSATCQSCHASCLSCTGPLETDCINCPSPYFLDLSSNRCVQVCQIGTIVDKVNFTCRQCPSKMVGYFHQCVSCSPTCENCYGTSFLQCLTCDQHSNFHLSTCLSNSSSTQKIIKSTGKSISIGNTLFSILILTGIICFVLEIFFTYKTPMLVVIEFIQIIGYMYFFSIDMSEQVQWILAYFYRFNFSNILTISSISVNDIPVKLNLMGKTGNYILDTLCAHILMILAVIILMLSKKGKSLSKVVQFIYEKLNPFLISYLYRLLILDQFFSLIIYLRYGGIQTAFGIASLVIVLLDFIFLGLGLLWKIRPSQYKDTKQYAMFYFNEIKQKQIDSENIKLNEVQEQNKTQNKSFNLLTLLFYVGKIPFPLAMVIFINNGVYQAICVVGYSLFFTILIAILPYKRKIYRVLYVVGSLVVVLTSGLFLAVYRNNDYSVALEIIWLIYFLFVFLVTVFQLVINYQFFIQIIKYTFRKIHNFFTQENNSVQSISNLQQQNTLQQMSLECIQKSQIDKLDLKYQNQSASIKEQNSHLKDKFDKSAENLQIDEIPAKQSRNQNFTDTPFDKKQSKSLINDLQKNRSQYENLYDSSFLTDVQKIKISSKKKNSEEFDVELDLDL